MCLVFLRLRVKWYVYFCNFFFFCIVRVVGVKMCIGEYLSSEIGWEMLYLGEVVGIVYVKDLGWLVYLRWGYVRYLEVYVCYGGWC